MPRVTALASGLHQPWSLCFLPDGRALVTEKLGRLRLLQSNLKDYSNISGVPSVVYEGQAGLFEVVLDPAFATNRRLYLSYAEPAESGSTNGLAVLRARLSDDATRLEDPRVIFRQAPKIDGSKHYAGRLVFRRDGSLFVTLGERDSQRNEAQNLANHLGKIARITTDGGIPGGNPYGDAAGLQAALWSYGHRNIQGAALHPETGELWVCEHGPQGGDEVNIARPATNQGWPVVSYGCEYGSPEGDACRIGGGVHAPRFVEPLSTWTPTSIAPSGLAFYTGDRFPEWRGNLFTGALAGTALWRLTLDGERVVGRERLLADRGERIRDVRQGPDGWLYLLTDSTEGRLLRVER